MIRSSGVSTLTLFALSTLNTFMVRQHAQNAICCIHSCAVVLRISLLVTQPSHFTPTVLYDNMTSEGIVDSLISNSNHVPTGIMRNMKSTGIMRNMKKGYGLSYSS